VKPLLHREQWVCSSRLSKILGVGAGCWVALICGVGIAQERRETPPQTPQRSEAELRLEEAGEMSGNAARLELAGMFLARGEAEEARAVLERVRQPGAAEAQYVRVLQAGLLLREKRWTEAEAIFAAVLDAKVPVPSEVLVEAALGRCEALRQGQSAAVAGRNLLQFLQGGRELPGAEPVFKTLVEVLSESTESVEAELRAGIRNGSPEYRALGQFYLAQFYFYIGKAAKAVESLQMFCEHFPEHRLLGAALLQRAEQAMEAGNAKEGLRLLEAIDGHTEDIQVKRLSQIRHALAQFQLKAFDRALVEFGEVAGHWPELGVEARYNAGLCATRLGNFKRATQELEFLRAAPESGALTAELELEVALHRASSGQVQADEALQSFIRAHPGHPRLGDARVALAGLCSVEAQNTQTDVGPGSARALRERAATLLRTVANDPQSSKAAVQAKALAVFLADAAEGRNEEEVLQQGEAFVRDYAGSPLTGQMRMKLGEIYFRRKDYANAEAQFATLAEQQVNSDLAETALYLAGQCASSLLNQGSVDRALAYWDKVAQGAGALRWKARYQQAAVKSRLGEEAEGAVLFDLILRAPSGVDAELRAAARCGKADALLSLAKREGEALEGALAEYRILAASGVGPVWRNQALYKIGKALETNDPEEALKAFYEVLDAPGSAEAGEFFWLHKAGFDAARLLESRRAFREAATLYERLATLGGPRGEEARQRALQLRLEHFIWE
jgi:outer membrane protein assembly factor BamD (BamD/ComL family)/predicted negative regulator of RcsB-dependent stress response